MAIPATWWPHTVDKKADQGLQTPTTRGRAPMTEEDEEFNRIEREAAMRQAAVKATMTPRQWVGLTTVERAHIYNTLPTYEWMQAVEDKLKEKNDRHP